jgi:class 3 adenylate cyclase
MCRLWRRSSEGDIFGDGVNVAARLEGVAQPDGISISEDAWRQVQGKVTANDIGDQHLKNIPRPVRFIARNVAKQCGQRPPRCPNC